jgi:hypothetical protein
VINTERFAPRESAQVIAAAARALGGKNAKAVKKTKAVSKKKKKKTTKAKGRKR